MSEDKRDLGPRRMGPNVAKILSTYDRDRAIHGTRKPIELPAYEPVKVNVAAPMIPASESESTFVDKPVEDIAKEDVSVSMGDVDDLEESGGETVEATEPSVMVHSDSVDMVADEDTVAVNTMEISDIDVAIMDEKDKYDLYLKLQKDLHREDDLIGSNNNINVNASMTSISITDGSDVSGISAFPSEILSFYRQYLLDNVKPGSDLDSLLRASNKAAKVSNSRLIQAVCISQSSGIITSDDKIVMAMAKVLSDSQMNMQILLDKLETIKKLIGNLGSVVNPTRTKVNRLEQTNEGIGLLLSFFLNNFMDKIPQNQLYTGKSGDFNLGSKITEEVFDKAKEAGLNRINIRDDRTGRSNSGRRR